jgi:hypothetical protein
MHMMTSILPWRTHDWIARTRSGSWCRAILALASAACSSGATEEYGFVTTLGRDTIAVERVTRSPSRLVADGVDQFPLVRRRHAEYVLGPDGRIQRMTMEVRTPNDSTPAARWRRVTAVVGARVVRVSVQDSGATRDTTFVHAGYPVVPHASMVYSVIEHEIASALAMLKAQPGDSAWFRQFYPDRDVGRTFAFHRGRVVPKGNGRVELRHDWLAGTGVAQVDSGGRMLSYDGSRTTYDVRVTRTAPPVDLDGIAARLIDAERRRGTGQLSVRDTVRATIGRAEVMVDYGRPLRRGRELLGGLVPLDRVWRTGANAATQLITNAPITLGGVRVPAGTVTLYTLPSASGVRLIINSMSGQWGTRYDANMDLGRVPMQVTRSANDVEAFTVTIAPRGSNDGELTMEWGTFRWTVPLRGAT